MQVFSRLLELLGWRSRKAASSDAAPPGDRFPYLRDDPANPVDLEANDAGLQFVTPAGRSDIIPWKAIRRVRLYCDFARSRSPFRTDGVLYCCAISSRGREDLVLAHLTLENGEVIDRSAAYRGFILALHARMLANAPRRIDLRAGRTWRWVVSDGIPENVEGRLEWMSPWLAAAIVLLARLDHTMPADYQVLRRNLPSRYHPAHIPARILPSESAP